MEVAMSPTFGNALTALKAGKQVARGGWNGKGMYLMLQTPDENSKMQQPYIYMSPVDGKLIPWTASQADILSEDWFVLPEMGQNGSAVAA